MIVNETKTEMVLFCKSNDAKNVEINVNGNIIKSAEVMKILGVLFHRHLEWKPQVDKVICQASKLSYGLKFLKKRLNQKQFLQATTSQFYGLVYYGSPVWLGSHLKKKELNRLTSLHYRLLRIATNDWKKRKKRETLGKIGRATPRQWYYFATASIVIKTLNNRAPTKLREFIEKNCFKERRKQKQFLFYDASSNKYGHHAIQNRLTAIFKILDFGQENISSDSLRTNLKKCIGFGKNL